MRRIIVSLLSCFLLINLSTISIFADDDQSVELTYSVPAHITLDDGTNVTEQDVYLGEKIANPGCNVPEGKVLSGWYYSLGGQEYKWNFNTMVVTSAVLEDGINLKLYARFEAKETDQSQSTVPDKQETAGQQKSMSEKEENQEVIEEIQETIEENVINKTSPLENFLKASLKFDIEYIPLTKEEKKLLEDGATLTVVMNTVEVIEPEEDSRKLIEDYAEAKEGTVVYFFDITITKEINGIVERITETNGKLEITINIPDDIFGEDKEYLVIRTHKNDDGSYLTDAVYSGPATSDRKIVFESDKFSTYALATKNVTISPETEKNNTYIYAGVAVLAVVAGIAAFIIASKKKKNK